ncbi:MAG TPA: septum site-determining protein MinC [Polyangia bacterium]|nr:septum site-determining protein MinC [Polyangia bacterium]
MEAAALADDDEPDLFGTETMAELCARQGQAGRAAAIYRRLIAASANAPAAWRQRLAALEKVAPSGPPPTPPPIPREALRPVPAPAPHRPALVVRQPVRSGQVVHADGDLVVMAPVNPGAQVVADGHIHLYAPLRGRAVAGAGGSSEARIFCLRLEAEVVAINGVYLAADDMDLQWRGRAVQISLRDGACVIEAL